MTIPDAGPGKAGRRAGARSGPAVHREMPAPGGSVSVVMPCWNAAATLPRALASVAAQSLAPAELICVDDASTDTTGAVLAAFAQHSPFPVRVIRLCHNGGAARARNAALAVASGEWIAFLDSDDAWHPRKLAAQLALAGSTGAQLLGGRSDQAAPPEAGAAPPWPDLPALSAVPVHLATALWRNPFHTSTVLVRARPGLAFAEGRLSEDFALWLALLRQGVPAVRHGPGTARMFKAAHGAGGLSARHWQMERGELAALADACRGRPWLLPPAWLLSLAKFSLRVVSSALR